MATKKFEKPSPYTHKAAPAPKEDSKYLQYENDIKLCPRLNKNERLGFALFGVGRAGTIHLSFLIHSCQVKLLYIVDDDKSKWQKITNYWNLSGVEFLTNSEAAAVYKDCRVRAVVVASPTHTHEDIVTQALDNEKSVFCEKPVAETYEKTKMLYEKAAKVKQVLFSAFNRRFDPSFQCVKDRVHRGAVGKVLTIKLCSRDSPLPSLAYLKSSGGIFHDCAVHDIDQTVSILAEYPSRVSVVAKANIPEIAAIDDFDTVAIVMAYQSGTVAIIDLSRHCTYGYDQRLEVFGQAGMIKAENQMPLSNVESYSNEGVEKAPLFYSFASRYEEGYQREMSHFIDVVQGKAELCINWKDVLAVTKIASACEESARSGHPVDLEWGAF